MVLAEMRPVHKAIYVFLIVALVFTENRAIDKDRREFADNEALRRGQENAQFQTIADGLASSIQLSQQQFAETKSDIDRSIAVVTGGKSFAVITPQVWSGLVPISLSIRNSGNQTLTGVTVSIYGQHEFDFLNNPRNFYEAPVINVGTLHAGELRLHVGQGTAAICFGVSSFFFTPVHYSKTCHKSCPLWNNLRYYSEH